MNIKQIIGGVLVLSVIALVIVGVWRAAGTILAGSNYEAIPKWYGNGLSAGLTEQLSVASDGDLTTTADVTANGTTTIKRSYDGFMVGGGVAPASVATGSAITLYTHTGGPVACDASTGMLFADSTGYSPSLTVSVGTSTNGTATTNLVASSTLATSSDAVIAPSASLFTLDVDDTVTAIFADAYQPASSTNFSNWDIEFQMQCWLIGG